MREKRVPAPCTAQCDDPTREEKTGEEAIAAYLRWRHRYMPKADPLPDEPAPV